MVKKIILSLTAVSMLWATGATAAPSVGLESESSFVTDSFDAAISGSEVVFPYQTNRIYRIYAQKGYICDIRLQPGETITSVSAGDTTRWVIDRAKTGNGGRNAVEHLFVKPVFTGISTNMVIATNLRSYQLLVVSGNFYNPVVTWVVEKSLQQEARTAAIKNYAAIDPNKLNFDYKFNKKDLPWAPVKIFDDGRKTYIKMKDEIFSSDMPAFFVIDKKGKIVLANYRVIKGTYIIDRIFDKASLVVGKEKIMIKRK